MEAVVAEGDFCFENKDHCRSNANVQDCSLTRELKRFESKLEVMIVPQV